MRLSGHPFEKELREGRRRDRALAAEFVKAFSEGNGDALVRASGNMYEAGDDAWRIAIRAITNAPPVITRNIREAFLRLWTESKSVRLTVGDDLALLDLLRLLFPRYRGGPKRLFRGTTVRERRRRCYGVSWTTKVDVAERFARRWGALDGGVILETLAPPDAVIASVKYPEPFTEAEIEEIRRHAPHAKPVEFHEEREYLIDRRYLRLVKVLRQIPATVSPPPEAIQFLE